MVFVSSAKGGIEPGQFNPSLSTTQYSARCSIPHSAFFSATQPEEEALSDQEDA